MSNTDPTKNEQHRPNREMSNTDPTEKWATQTQQKNEQNRPNKKIGCVDSVTLVSD
jgi:hypothetical protein